MKNVRKARWSVLRRRAAGGKVTPERFHYRGDGNGRFLFYRYSNPFDWGPVECTRDEAKAFVDKLNQYTGKDIDRFARPIADAFIAKHRKAAANAEKGVPDRYAEKGVTDIAGPAESGTSEVKSGNQK